MNPSLLPWEVKRKRSQIEMDRRELSSLEMKRESMHAKLLALSRKIDRLIERITRNVRDLGARAE